MGYNTEDYIRVRDKFSKKYLLARQRAEERTQHIHTLIPEVFEIDRVLSGTGMDIMKVITSGEKNTDAAIAKLEARNNALIEKRNAYLTANGFPTDYTDVHYDCEKCGDTGYVDTVMCDCMKKALVKAGFESSGLGALIGKQTFDNFSLEYYEVANNRKRNAERLVEMLKQFAESFNDESYANFLITGTSGLGKTHLSSAVAEKVIERGYDVLYVSAISLISDFEENRFGSGMGSGKAHDVRRYYEADLLIIDDLGTEISNKFTQSCIYEVINTRINNRKSTIINTNLNSTEIKSVYSERIASRILGEYMPALLVGVDIRRQKSTGNKVN
ncbi:MAG: ATP-binding protein [Clostridia bacterium]|nr:ATP-binding protein [Clostridia bacterium]